MTAPVLTKDEVRAIRAELGWTLEQTGAALGYTGKYTRQIVHKFESGERTIPYAQAHLLLAIKDGYRPEKGVSGMGSA